VIAVDWPRSTVNRHKIDKGRSWVGYVQEPAAPARESFRVRIARSIYRYQFMNL